MMRAVNFGWLLGLMLMLMSASVVAEEPLQKPLREDGGSWLRVSGMLGMYGAYPGGVGL